MCVYINLLQKLMMHIHWKVSYFTHTGVRLCVYTNLHRNDIQIDGTYMYIYWKSIIFYTHWSMYIYGCVYIESLQKWCSDGWCIYTEKRIIFYTHWCVFVCVYRSDRQIDDAYILKKMKTFTVHRTWQWGPRKE